MKDEIKEILGSIQEHLKENEENFKKGAVDSTVYYLYCDDARTLLDYIINLQESEAYYYGHYKDYTLRNEKAIEYIKQYKELDFSDLDLLSILQGEDKDE